MGYVAVKGGAEAIKHAARSVAFERVKGKSRPLHIDQVKEQLYLGVDRIMSEGALYAPDLAALALKQAAGDTLEAAFMLRAYRTTKARIGYSIPCSTSEMRVIRRISAAFKDIPGGQVLGATRDYSIRLLDFELIDDPPWKRKQLMKDILSDVAPGRLPDSFPRIIDLLRREGLLVGPGHGSPRDPGDRRYHAAAPHVSRRQARGPPDHDERGDRRPARPGLFFDAWLRRCPSDYR